RIRRGDLKMNPGFYKRRRGILEHLESGEIGLIDLAVHDFLCLKMNGVKAANCHIPPGIVFTSSKAIYAQCPKGDISERGIRRSLERLEKLGWIKRWIVDGKHGNYPVLIARATVHDEAGTEYRINAQATTDWKQPVLYKVPDSATSRPRGVHEVSTSRPLIENRELRIEKKNKNIPSPSAPVLVGFDSFWNIFPRKQDKKDAQKAWSKIPETERSAVIAAVERFKLTEQWQKEGGKYIPYPSRFLNGRRWEDEILTSTAQIPAESNGRAPRIPTAADCRPRI